LKTASAFASAILSAALSAPQAIAAPLPLATAPADAGCKPFTQVTSLAASSRSIQAAAVLYAAGYDSGDWSGRITAHTMQGASFWGSQPGHPDRPQSTASLMDGKDDGWPASRLVLSARAGTGIAWEWAQLGDDQKTALQTVDGALDTSAGAAAAAQARLAWLRGDRGQEQPAGSLRQRGSRHGDIVNSKLWYLAGQPASGYGIENYAAFRGAARAAMLYAGANDGMLHGFDAATGEERLAYVPEGLHPKLAALTQPGYAHQYHVDGSPFTGDLYLGAPGGKDATKWRTYLAGFPGAGGRGYFVLDVTNPAAFTAEPADLVVLDQTSADALDPDVGHLVGEPVMEGDLPSVTRQITRMNDGRWALIMGNGYNSARERPALLIQYLDGARELFKIVADAAGEGNGLSPPRLIDLNGDDTPDLAYAGDLRGNLWKFDLGGASPGQWQVAFDGQPLFTAIDGATPQPITTAPVWAAHPDGGLMLAFGTGRNLTAADRGDASRQSIYGIHDTGKSRVSGRGELAGQKMIMSLAQPVGTVSSNPVPYAGPGARRGWFIDLPIAGQRVLRNPTWFDGDLIDVESTAPQPCAADKRYRTTIDIIQGQPPRLRIYSTLPPMSEGPVATVEIGLSAPLSGDKQTLGATAPGAPPAPPRDRPAAFLKRASWRQLQ
jgi:type IV pilus assembly protein PilY1